MLSNEANPIFILFRHGREFVAIRGNQSCGQGLREHERKAVGERYTAFHRLERSDLLTKLRRDVFATHNVKRLEALAALGERLLHRSRDGSRSKLRRDSARGRNTDALDLTESHEPVRRLVRPSR